MRIYGEDHGVRLYESKVQSHDLRGIDITKLTPFIPAISSDSVKFMKPFKFTNDDNSLQMLQSRLVELFRSDDSIIIDFESMASLLPVTKTCVLNRIITSIAQIKLLNSQLDNIEAQMAEITKFHDFVIMTILGIDYINDGMTLGEIKDIHHFPSPTELPAFADLTWCFLFTSFSMPYNI